MENVNKLKEEKYSTWEWNYGSSPAFNFSKSQRFSCGKVDIRLDVNKGILEQVKIFGDFFSSADIVELEQLLEGNKYDKDLLKEKLTEINLEKYFDQKILIRKLGGKELVFESNGEISIGEKRIVSFEYKGEKILIPGIISGKIHENNKIICFFEYLEMEDKCLSKVYRAIFKKQVELKLKV